MSNRAMQPSQKARLAADLERLVRQRICHAICPQMTFGANCRFCKQGASAALAAVDEFTSNTVAEVK